MDSKQFGKIRLTIIDFFFHGATTTSSGRALVRERIHAQLFHNLLGDANLLEAVRVHEYFEVLLGLRDLRYDILQSNRISKSVNFLFFLCCCLSSIKRNDF